MSATMARPVTYVNVFAMGRRDPIGPIGRIGRMGRMERMGRMGGVSSG